MEQTEGRPGTRAVESHKNRMNKKRLGTSNTGNLTGKLMGTLAMAAWYCDTIIFQGNASFSLK